jgi:hypothetical protein
MLCPLLLVRNGKELYTGPMNEAEAFVMPDLVF